MRDMTDHAERSRAQQEGVYHGQMIGAYNPRPFVSGKFRGTLTAEFPQIPYPVKQNARDKKVKRRNQKNGHPT